jgi:Holliday junction resolvase
LTNSRAKGAAFERDVAKRLHTELGVTFKRDLDQYRQRDRGDLIADNPAFPFIIECKARASGGFQAAWMEQAMRAADDAGMWPAVIYKINRQQIRVRLHLCDLMVAMGSSALPGDQIAVDVDLAGFAFIAREAMA